MQGTKFYIQGNAEGRKR